MQLDLVHRMVVDVEHTEDGGDEDGGARVEVFLANALVYSLILLC